MCSIIANPNPQVQGWTSGPLDPCLDLIISLFSRSTLLDTSDFHPKNYLISIFIRQQVGYEAVQKALPTLSTHTTRCNYLVGCNLLNESIEKITRTKKDPNTGHCSNTFAPTFLLHLAFPYFSSSFCILIFNFETYRQPNGWSGWSGWSGKLFIFIR